MRYFVLSLAALCYSTAGTTYSFFDPVLGPHLQSVRSFNNNDDNNNDDDYNKNDGLLAFH